MDYATHRHNNKSYGERSDGGGLYRPGGADRGRTARRAAGRLAPGGHGGATLDAIVGRSGIDPAAIEDVIMGCVSQGGEQSFQVGRGAVLASSLPTSVPAVTIDRQCGSSQQAIQFAAQAVMSGTQDVVIAAGVESMTRVPMGSTGALFAQAGLGKAKSPRQEARFPACSSASSWAPR